jgi:hypothetical protein
MRAHVCVALFVIPSLASLTAQESTARGAPGRVCLHARPKPDCSGFFLTNAGAYVVLGGDNSGGDTPLRGVVDYGFMSNVTTRDAVGVSVFASLDRAGFAVGPAVRYRRWLSPSASLEVAVGKPLAGDADMQTGAVFGLVKWSPNHWFALAARPERIREVVCGLSTCAYESHGRVSFGAEAGAVPGLVVTGATGVVFLAFLALLAGAYSD